MAFGSNFVLLAFATSFALLVGEVAMRLSLGYSISFEKLPFEIPEVEMKDSFFQEVTQQLELDSTINNVWWQHMPEPVQHVFENELDSIESKMKAPNGEVIGPPMIKAYNLNFLRQEACLTESSMFLKGFAGWVYCFVPPSESVHFIYRYLPNSRTSSQASGWNNFGFRGQNIDFEKPDSVFRIFFVGGSTTQQASNFTLSYPEFIGHWLNLWAAANKLSVRFEVQNAGREGLVYNDSERIIIDEIVPLQPDMVVYYAGINNMTFEPIIDVDNFESSTDKTPYFNFVYDHSVLIRALGSQINLMSLCPPSKSSALTNISNLTGALSDTLVLPVLPFEWNNLIKSFQRIRMELQRANAQLLISSFVLMSEENLDFNPFRHPHLYGSLNAYRPLSYGDLGWGAAYLNQMYASYCAQVEGVEYLPIAEHFPLEPVLFKDHVHMTETGIKLRAWITFSKMIPHVRTKLSANSFRLPRQQDSVAVGTAYQTKRLKVPLQCECIENLSSVKACLF